MKLVIASDIHGAASWCARLTAAIAAERPDRVLLLGDLLYHGPRNDIPADYAPRDVIAQLSALSDLIIAVRGNCEAEVDQMVLPFACLSDSNTLLDPATGRSLFLTHGHVFGPGLHGSVARLPTLAPGTAVVFGHTHIKVSGPADELLAGVGDEGRPAAGGAAGAGVGVGGGAGDTAGGHVARGTDGSATGVGAGGDASGSSGSLADTVRGRGLWLFNPGSVGIPKDGTHSYGIYEDGRFEHRLL